jgi:TolB-like protein/DNA-binding winged helix-turn-helix (wHTH) protein/Tfp pilus assembly protein PilF
VGRDKIPFIQQEYGKAIVASDPPGTRETIRFGEFELDRRAYQLRRSGRVLRLERIPMDLLILLIDQPGELVSREHIVEKIWGKGVFLDTDNSINGAVRKLRRVLKDNPDQPRFIQTIAGRGYRFVAAVNGAERAEPMSRQEQEAPAKTAGAAHPEASESQELQPSSASATTASSHALRRLLIGLGFLAMLVVAAGVMLRRSAPAAPPSGNRPMLAVLPFQNLTGDPGQDYFSDGFTEEMITRLGTLAPQRLGVIARTSVMYYRQSHTPMDRLARELGVQYVLEGSIRRDSDRVRITAQLIQVKDQTHLWAQHYDRKQTDVIQVQEEIAQAISDQIELALGPFKPVRTRLHPLSEKSYEAYEHYLRGRYFWNKRTSEDFKRAAESFQQAIDMEPEDARAYAGLADAYALMSTWSYAPAVEAVPKARAAAFKALEIDPNLGAALPSLALINECFDLDWSTAEARFKKAIELDPNYATAHHWYSELLYRQGRFGEALRESAIAGKLDPRSLIIAVDRAFILYYARQYDRSIEQYRSVMAVDPRFPRTLGIVSPYIEQSRYDEAMEEARRWQGTSGNEPYVWVTMAEIYARLGQLGKAREALREAEQAARRIDMDPAGLRIRVYVSMGMKEEAMALLQEVCRKNAPSLINVKVEPFLDPLRGDPRFDDLVRCVHLEP